MVQLQLDDIMNNIEEEEVHIGQLVNENELHKTIKLNNKVLNLLHLNIRSANRNFDNFILLIQTYNLYFVDVFILSEAFRDTCIIGCNIPGYKTYFNDAGYNRNDGVLILVRNDIKAEFSILKFPLSKATLGRLECRVGDSSMGIVAAYKPPPIPKIDFTKDLHDYLAALGNSNKLEPLVGDTNFNILDTVDDENFNYISTLAELGFTSYINTITRNDTNSCLDHIFVKKVQNPNSFGFQSFTLDHHITDHIPVMINILTKKSLPRQTTPQVEHGNKQNFIIKTDLDKLKQTLNNQDWSPVTNDYNPETATNEFISIFNKALEEAKTISTLKQYKKRKTWITNGLVTSIKHRDRLKRNLIKNYSIELEKEYKAYRNYLQKLIVKQKNEFYQNEINRNKNNIRKLYHVIKECTNENQSKNEQVIIHREDSTEFRDDKGMANYCNHYFSGIGLDMAKKIPDTDNPYELKNPNPDSLFLFPVNRNELIMHISALKTNSAPGHDGIPTNIIKKTHLEILTPLTHIFNLCFETGIVPTHFKSTVIVPIHKNGSKTDIKNYRPISLINGFAKVFEKCLKQKLVDFLNKCNILHKNQFGFLAGCSTDDALYEFTAKIMENLNTGRKCAGLFIDLAKAFDTVPHNRLLNTLEHYGVRGTALAVFESYLKSRHQLVKLNGTISDGHEIRIGVPQGTVLGPILFVIYLNSLLGVDIEGSIISFADDTVLVFDGIDWNDVKNKMRKGLTKVKDWLNTNKLSLNLKKTKYIAFSLTVSTRPDYSYITLEDEQINEVPKIKYLGVIVDRHMKWHEHINYISNKIRKLIYRFYCLRYILNKKNLVIIYKSFIESLIRYGILVWGGLYDNALYKLNIVQKKILKIIYNKNRMYPTRLLFTYDTCNVRTIYMSTICGYIRKRNSLQNIVNHQYHTRNKENKNISIPVSHRNINLRFFDYLAPKIYNKLPCNIKGIARKNVFARECKTYILNNYNLFGEVFK